MRRLASHLVMLTALAAGEANGELLGLEGTAGGKVVFASNRSGSYELYVMESDGSNPTRLTDSPGDNHTPSCSPDGGKIAFMSSRDGNREIYVMNRDGTNQLRLTNDPAEDHRPSWSPDGRRIAFQSKRDGTTQIYLMDPDGTNLQKITNTSWNYDPVWSPDGSEIAFTSYRPGDFEIYVMNADGTSPTRLTNMPGRDTAPHWSPEGNRIAFVSQRNGNAEIYLMNTDGANPTRLTQDPAGDEWPHWSPDAGKIVFKSSRDGNNEIYLMNADGTNQVNITNSPLSTDFSPAWLVPEPSTLVLLGVGAVGLLAYAWRKHRGTRCLRRTLASLAVTISLVLSANVSQGTMIELVTVGHPGNAGELSGESAGGSGPDRMCGAVDYTYRIGKYEVTAGQYCEFLNAVAATDAYRLYDARMWSERLGCKIQRSGSSGSYTYSAAADWADRPVNYVSWGSAARFANWLHNGRPKGTLTGDPAQDAALTEDGAYFLNRAMNDTHLLAISREADWQWAIPTEDEWYKAAYHRNDGVTGNYYDYPTSSNSVPSNDLIAPDPGNNATFFDNDYTIGGPYYRTESGAHENSKSPYGTFDQGGNVWEWNETIMCDSYRGLRGGRFDGSPPQSLHASYRSFFGTPTHGHGGRGFRVVNVPEPGSITLLACGAVGLLAYAWRKRCRTGHLRRRLGTLGATISVALSASVSQGVTIELVTVGNPGNAGELSGEGAGGTGLDRICGAVDYVYEIGKYEVTNAQYAEFLNAVDPQGENPHDLYRAGYASIGFNPPDPAGLKYHAQSGRERKPVTEARMGQQAGMEVFEAETEFGGFPASRDSVTLVATGGQPLECRGWGGGGGGNSAFWFDPGMIRGKENSCRLRLQAPTKVTEHVLRAAFKDVPLAE